MKELFFSIIAAALFLASCTEKPGTPLAVLTKLKENYDKHSSIVYKINFKHKFFSSDDTVVRNATCNLVRDASDTLYGGLFWNTVSDSLDRYYDLNNIYVIDHPQKKITEYKAHEHQTGPIDGNVTGNVIKVSFLNTDLLLSDLKDTSNKATLFTDKDHFLITINYADKEPFSDAERKIWIRTSDFVIDKIIRKIKFQGNYQYTEWNLSDIEFDKVSAGDLSKTLQSYSQSYTTAQYIPINHEDYDLLQAGTPAPPFSGTAFQNGKDINSNDLKGKFVVLDFSYMSCMPCIKSIPHLRQIQNEYGNKNVVVLAINSKDTEEKSKKRLPNFISANSVNYPIVLTTGRTDSIYKVTVYPTLYAIDKTGKIVYSQMGLSDNLLDTLRAIINKQL
jgi:thiol-disulfide isomerase/thioredoxin